MEPLKGHGDGKKEKYFNAFAFSHKTFAFPQQTLCLFTKLLHSTQEIQTAT